MMFKQLCPCGTGQAFAQCCQPYIQGQTGAPTPEALMRSRYSAFTTQSVDYLLKTHHPTQRSPNERSSLQHSCQSTAWKRLVVLDSGVTDPSHGFVEFMAVYDAGRVEQLHERSTFVKESGQWFYWNGQLLPPVKPNRGEPCWCGSGKKYKRCHG